MEWHFSSTIILHVSSLAHPHCTVPDSEAGMQSTDIGAVPVSESDLARGSNHAAFRSKIPPRSACHGGLPSFG
eukprot:6793806-Alexandrium_andersonii.AAC.1